MSKEYKILSTQNRIQVLSGRNKENGRIIAKLQRRLRKLMSETE